jgi:hypothetical protein
MNAVAFDYDRQIWVSDPNAVVIRRKQLAAELTLLTGPRGAEYLAFAAKTSEPVLTLEQAILKCRHALADSIAEYGHGAAAFLAGAQVRPASDGSE